MAKYNKENVQKASTMYSIYSSLNQFTGPANVDEMKEFLATDQRALKRLELIGIATGKFDEYLTGRDGEPLEFRWAVKTTPVAAAYPICFEKTGIDGIRQVGFSGTKIEEVSDDARYKSLLKGKFRPDQGERYHPKIQTQVSSAR